MPSANRTIQFLMRLSPDERELFEKAAAADGLPMGTWLRTAGLKAAQRRMAEIKKQETASGATREG